MKSNAEFVKDFVDSLPTVLQVATWLYARGNDVWLRPPLLRGDPSERFKFTDDGDIALIKNGVRWRVEVKQRSINFTNCNDFPYQTVIVDEGYKIDSDGKDPLMAYAIVSSDRLHAAWVTASTKDRWTRSSRFDSRQGRTCEFVECPKSCVVWGDINIDGTRAT